MKLHFCFLISCLLVAFGCEQKSGNIWEDNQTGAKYLHENTTSLLWENREATPEPLLPLNEADLRSQFAETPFPSQRELGDRGMPSADQFETPRGELAAIFTPVFFNTDQHILASKEYLETLQRVASYLKAHPKVYVIVEGHCDERASEAYNLALGTRRANHVRATLLQAGVRAEQVHAVSLGKEHPFALGHTPEIWKQNRRAHFRVHSEGK